MAANTFVFIDLETHDLFMPKITEICLVAVTRSHILEANKNKEFSPPRALNKLSLCISPRATIHPRASDITGLTNEMLEEFPVFNAHVASSIQTFFQLLPEPVCMIAHNGFKFDFPVLKVALHKLKQSLPVPVRCSDTLPGFKKVFNDWSIIANNPSDEIGAEVIKGTCKIVIKEIVINNQTTVTTNGLGNGASTSAAISTSKNSTSGTVNNTSNQTVTKNSGTVNNTSNRTVTKSTNSGAVNNTSNQTVTNASGNGSKNGNPVNNTYNQVVKNTSSEASTSKNYMHLLDDGNDDYFADIDCDQLQADADAYEYFSQIIEPSDVDFDIRKSCSQLSWDQSSVITPKRARLDESNVNGDTSPVPMCVDVETNTVLTKGNKSAGEPAPAPCAKNPVKIRKDLFPPLAPPVSYKLEDVYERLRNSRPVAHRAEADVLMMLECVLVMGQEILQYFDDNFMLFEDIKIPNDR